MGAIGALSMAAGALRRNPVIVLGVLALSVVGSLSTVGQVVGGTVTTAVVGIAVFLLTPFLTGGVLGMAEEAVDDRTGLRILLDEGRANYRSLLGATIIEIVLLIGVGIVWAIVLLVLAASGSVTFSGAGSGVLGSGLDLRSASLFAVSIVVFLVAIYFIQFYNVAVVVDNTGSWGAFKRSYAVVRRNPLSVLGYTLIAQVINLVVLVPTFWLMFDGLDGLSVESAVAGGTGGMAGSATLADVVPELAIALALGTLVSSFLLTYQVAYYGDVTSERTTSADSIEGQTAD